MGDISGEYIITELVIEYQNYQDASVDDKGEEEGDEEREGAEGEEANPGAVSRSSADDAADGACACAGSVRRAG